MKFYFENDRIESRPPGTLFQYDSSGSFVLGALVEKLSGMTLIGYLEKQNIRVICASDNTDSFNEDDEFRMEVNQFMNHLYSRDTAKKVRSGYRQKQKDQGVCNMPPMGYKDTCVYEITIHVGENVSPVNKISVMFNSKLCVIPLTIPIVLLG